MWNSRPQVLRQPFVKCSSWAAVIALAFLPWIPRLTGPIDFRWDGSVYYLLGTSLANGEGYRIPSEPGSPEAVQYPPLLPAIVAVHQRIFGTSKPADIGPRLRLSYALMFVTYGLIVFALARRYVMPWLAVVVTSFCVLHHLTIFLSDLLFAELPFALVSAAFAIIVVPAKASSTSWARETVGFLFAAAAFLLKTTGLALLAAWVGEALLRRRWKLAFIRCGLALLPLVGWQLHVTRVLASHEYRHPAYDYQRSAYQYSNVTYTTNASLIDPFRPEFGTMTATTLAERLANNVPWLVMAVGETLSATTDTWPLRRLQARLVRRAVSTPTEKITESAPAKRGAHKSSFLTRYALFGIPLFGLVAIIGVGLVALFRQRAWLLFLVITTTLFLIWLTPWQVQFPRYLMPLMPFLAICAALGFSRVYRSITNSRRLRLIGLPVLIALVLICVATHIIVPIKLFHERAAPAGIFHAGGIGTAPRFFAHDHSWQNWEDAAGWVDVYTPADTIVGTSSPHLLYLLTGRRAVLPPMEADPQRERQLLEEVPVSYVIIDNLEALDVTHRYVLPAVDGTSGWKLMHVIDATRIYRHYRNINGDLP